MVIANVILDDHKIVKGKTKAAPKIETSVASLMLTSKTDTETVMDKSRLTGWLKPRDIWQSNF